MFDKFFGKKKNDYNTKKVKTVEQKTCVGEKEEKTVTKTEVSLTGDEKGFIKIEDSSHPSCIDDLEIYPMSKIDDGKKNSTDFVGKSQGILDNDVDIYGRKRKSVNFPITYTTVDSKYEMAISIIFIQKGVFGNDILKFVALAEEIAYKYYKCISNGKHYTSNKIFKYLFGNGEENLKDCESKGENLVEIFEYLSSLDLIDLKLSNNLGVFNNKEKCVQIIILGDGNFSYNSEDEISIIKKEISRIREKEINTYFITANKYNLADIARLGFRNIECINHDYNKI